MSGREREDLGVDERLDGPRHREFRREERRDAGQRPAPEVLNRLAPPVGRREEDSNEPLDKQLEVRAGFAGRTDR